MAQKRYRQGPWPPKVDDQPVARFQTADGWLKSDRSLAGPLRTGTAPGVGPRGVSAGGESRLSDMGTDRISPRDFDVLGTCRNRFGDISSDLITRQVRGRNGR